MLIQHDSAAEVANAVIILIKALVSNSTARSQILIQEECSSTKNSRMGTLQRDPKQTTVLATLGFLSGLVTCASLLHFPFQSTELFPFSGIIFAFALSLYSWWFERLHSPWRVLSFVIASTAAFYIAMIAGVFGLSALVPFIGGGESNFGKLGTAAVFLGGLAGTALVAVARYWFLSDPQDSRTLRRRIGLISLVGGVLGATGFALGPSMGTSIWDLLQFLHVIAPTQSSVGGASKDTASFFSMFLMWQTAIAPLLAILFPYARISAQIPAGPSSSPPEKRLLASPVWKNLLVVAALVFLAYHLVEGIRTRRQIARLEAKVKSETAQLYAEAPSLDNLPAIDPLPPEQALILHSIHGCIPGPPLVQNRSPADPRPPLPAGAVSSRSYLVVYEIPNSGRIQNIVAATASVTLFPNAEWANYEMTDHPIPGHSRTNLVSTRKVSKYGNTIYLNTTSFGVPMSRFCYAWPSDNFKVSLCLADPADEEFLREYLILHPSSLN